MGCTAMRSADETISDKVIMVDAFEPVPRAVSAEGGATRGGDGKMAVELAAAGAGRGRSVRRRKRQIERTAKQGIIRRDCNAVGVEEGRRQRQGWCNTTNGSVRRDGAASGGQ